MTSDLGSVIVRCCSPNGVKKKKKNGVLWRHAIWVTCDFLLQEEEVLSLRAKEKWYGRLQATHLEIRELTGWAGCHDSPRTYRYEVPGFPGGCTVVRRVIRPQVKCSGWVIPIHLWKIRALGLFVPQSESFPYLYFRHVSYETFCLYQFSKTFTKK